MLPVEGQNSCSSADKMREKREDKLPAYSDTEEEARLERRSKRSRSPMYRKDKKRERSRYRRRSPSYSPYRDAHKRHDSPLEISHCLGIFGLSSLTEEKDLQEVFGAYGDIEKLCVVYDKQTGQSRGFGFVYFKSTPDAVTAKKETHGLLLDGRAIRVDYSFTLEPNSQTSGGYRNNSRQTVTYSRGPKYNNRGYGRVRNFRRSSDHYSSYSRGKLERDNYSPAYERRSSYRGHSPPSSRYY